MTPQRDVGQLYDVALKVLKPPFKFGWNVAVKGLGHLPKSGPAIICPNHTSVLDSFFLPLILPRRITYVGKAEYMDDWKTKYLFPALGMVPIDRSGGNASAAALDTAQQILQRGELFGIYPEGTRSRDGRLYRGHTGPARLALRTGAPIVPVGIRGSREIMPPDAKFPKLFKACLVQVGRPIDVARYRARADDRMVLRQIIDEVMYSIRDLSGQDYVDTYATKRAETLPTETAKVTTADRSAPTLARPETGASNGSRRSSGDCSDTEADLQDPSAQQRSSADVLGGARARARRS